MSNWIIQEIGPHSLGRFRSRVPWIISASRRVFRIEYSGSFSAIRFKQLNLEEKGEREKITSASHSFKESATWVELQAAKFRRKR